MYLGKRLREDTYEPSPAGNVYPPKKSGVLRAYTLLAIEDQITYQALANIVAERLAPKVRHRYRKQVFGHLARRQAQPVLLPQVAGRVPRVHGSDTQRRPRRLRLHRKF